MGDDSREGLIRISVWKTDCFKKQRCHDMSDSNTLWGPVMETLLKTVSRKHPPEKKGPNKGFVLLVHGSYIEQ